MVYIKNDPGYLNSIYSYEDPSMSFNVSNKITYKLDPEYWKARVKKYRENNLAIVKARQKAWYDRRPEVVRRRRMQYLGINLTTRTTSGIQKLKNNVNSKKKYRVISNTKKLKQILLKELQTKFHITPLDKRITRVINTNITNISHRRKEQVIKQLKERFHDHTTPYVKPYISISYKPVTISFD
jgi:ribosomal protein L20